VAAINAAKRSILDTLAVTVAGTRSRAGQSAIDAFAAREGGGSATVIGAPFRAHPSIAALVNGTLAHALDFDDVWADDDGVVAWRGHPSVCVLPAVLAAGEAEGCDGATALLAYIIGVEVEGKLGTVFGPHLGRIGFHPTPILGTLATAAAVARVLNVERERANVMLGIAATEASGLVRIDQVCRNESRVALLGITNYRFSVASPLLSTTARNPARLRALRLDARPCGDP